MDVTTIGVNAAREDIKKIENYINQQNASMDNISKEVSFLSEVWLDSAQLAFADEFEKTRKSVSEFNKALMTYVELTRDAVDRFERVDVAMRNVLK
jgi:uncharacterized protein YukE